MFVRASLSRRSNNLAFGLRRRIDNSVSATAKPDPRHNVDIPFSRGRRRSGDYGYYKWKRIYPEFYGAVEFEQSDDNLCEFFTAASIADGHGSNHWRDRADCGLKSRTRRRYIRSNDIHY